MLRQCLGLPRSGLRFTVFVAPGAAAPAARPAAPPAAAAQPPAVMGYPQAAAAAANQAQQAQQQAAAAAAVAAAAAAAAAAGQHAAQRREQTNDYAALFVALIGAAPALSKWRACCAWLLVMLAAEAAEATRAPDGAGARRARRERRAAGRGEHHRRPRRARLPPLHPGGPDGPGARPDQGPPARPGRREDILRAAGARRPPAACCPLPGLALRSRLPAPGPHAVAARPQDPNARNCHGYRKFVKRSVLENPSSGYLVADTIIIKYTIELVVSSGGALARAPGVSLPKLPTIQVGTRAALAGVGCGERGPAT